MNSSSAQERLKKDLFEEIKKSPEMGCLLVSILLGSRIVGLGPVAQELLASHSDLMELNNKSLSDLGFLRSLHSSDLVFVETEQEDQLWSLVQNTSAQIIHISEKTFDKTLFDFRMTPLEVRSMIKGLRPLIQKYQPEFKSQWIKGPQFQKALFLDRDGVVNIDYGYLSKPEQIELVPGIVELLKKAIGEKFKIFFVTNQSGVARGFFNIERAIQVNRELQKKLAQQGVFVDEASMAFYHESSQNLEGFFESSKRKPRAGMFVELIEKHRIDVSNSMMIGDSARDLQAAAIAGVKNLYLVEQACQEPENTHPSPSQEKLAAELKKWNEWPMLSRVLTQSKFKQIKSFDEIIL